MKLLLAFVLVLSLGTPVSASVMRVPLAKATLAKSPLKYAVTVTTGQGLVTVRLEMPRAQKPLDHLWRVDLVMRSGTKTVLSAPLATDTANGVLSTSFVLDPANLKGVEIWVRTGKAAPLAETIYEIDVESFK
jgi:hypothetical protein